MAQRIRLVFGACCHPAAQHDLEGRLQLMDVSKLSAKSNEPLSHNSHTQPYLLLKIARVRIQRWLTTQVHVKHIASSRYATFLDQLNHTSHTLSFVNGICDQCIGTRCKFHRFRCARPGDT